MTWTDEDLAVLAEAVELGPDAGLTHIIEHFTDAATGAQASDSAVSWTSEDLAVLAEAAELGPGEGLARISEHFTSRARQLLASRAVDALHRGEAVDLGDGAVFARDAPQSYTGQAFSEAG